MEVVKIQTKIGETKKKMKRSGFDRVKGRNDRLKEESQR